MCASHNKKVKRKAPRYNKKEDWKELRCIYLSGFRDSMDCGISTADTCYNDVKAQTVIEKLRNDDYYEEILVKMKNDCQSEDVCVIMNLIDKIHKHEYGYGMYD